MKKIQYYTCMLLIAYMSIFTACTKEGPVGPAGKDGVNGADGARMEEMALMARMVPMEMLT